MDGGPWRALEALAAEVEDGAMVATGGFLLDRPPMALTRALARSGKRRLRVLSVGSPLPADLLASAGAAEHLDCTHGALGLGFEQRPLPSLARARTQGRPICRIQDPGRTVQRLRAAAMGVPFLPAPEAAGTGPTRDEAPRRIRDPWTGHEVPVERALAPDVALLHVEEADEDGNLGLDASSLDLLLALAARRVLVTAERRVQRLSRIGLPALAVSGLALARGGARPGGCGRGSPPEPAELDDYWALSEAGRAQDYEPTARVAE
jgi:glutaconate CoA-transferase subunit A